MFAVTAAEVVESDLRAIRFGVQHTLSGQKQASH